MAMNAARPMGRLPTRRRSLRPKQIVSELQSKLRRRIANAPQRNLRPKQTASGEQQKLRRRTANAPRRKLKPKPIASELPQKLRPRTANEPRRKLRAKQPTAGGLTVDLRPRQEAHHALRTKLLRPREPKHRPRNNRPTIGAIKDSATKGKRKTNGPDLSTDAEHHAKRARRRWRALLLVAGIGFEPMTFRL